MNIIKLKGKIVEQECYKTFETHGEQFVEFKLAINRTSNAVDILPIIMSLKQFNSTGGNKFIEILGDLRTRNELVDGKSKLIVYVLAKEVKALDNEEYANEVKLQGFLCKEPVLRITPMTSRTIADCLFVINNNYNKSYYIPTIVFGINAIFVAEQKVGAEFQIVGRLQSRGYQKNIDGEIQERTAYEVCVKNIELIKKGE